MSSLSDKQIKFLDELGAGPKGLRELMDDHEMSWRDFRAWEADPAFAAALEEVFDWLAFARETDVRVGATEALRRQRQFVRGHDQHLSAQHRRVGNDLWNKARQVDRRFPRQFGRPGTAREISPVHPDHLHEAHEIVQRMEALRRAALEARAREKAAAAAARGATTGAAATSAASDAPGSVSSPEPAGAHGDGEEAET
jgi:hypothetical protein